VLVGQSLALQLSAHVKKWPGETLLTGADGGQLSPWALERAMRTARKKVEGLPEGFRYHDLRHYFASLLKVGAHGADVKTVQARLRHGSAITTLDTYGHLWPDKDESTKAVIDGLVDSKFRDLADSARTEGGAP
jgi:integrase